MTAADGLVRPSDLDGVPLVELAQAYSDHVGLLVDARHGIGRRLQPVRVAQAAVDALVTSAALAQQALAHRWLHVIEALQHGATMAAVCAALGDLDNDEVAAGVRAWASAQAALHRRHGSLGITPAQYDEIELLLTRALGDAQ